MTRLRLSLLTVPLSSFILTTTLPLSWAAGECSDEEDETVSALQSAQQLGRSASMQGRGDGASPRRLLSRRKDAGTCKEQGCSDVYQDWYDCQCNAKCGKHDNCCSDYEAECTESPSSGTCKKQGCSDVYQDWYECQCNAKCGKHDNCCSDYEAECTEVPGEPSASTGTCKAQGCSDKFVEGNECQCHAKCEKQGNCCDDYKAECTEESSSGPTGSGTGVKILVMSTPGASLPCCGKPSSECKLHKGNFTYSMGSAIVEGIKETAPNAEVRQVDIAYECLDYKELSEFDSIIVGAPVWNGIPSPDIISLLDDWPISDRSNKMRCKLAAAFTTGGGYYAGIQTTIETFHRIFQTFQMIIVGGASWPTGQGAAAITGTEPFEEGAYTNGDGVNIAAPQFLADARGLGARVGNFTSIMKETPTFCDIYLGLTHSSKR